MVGLRQQDVVVALDARAEGVEVALAADMQHRGPGGSPRGHRELVERPGAGEGAEDRDDVCVRGEPEALAPLTPGCARVRDRDRSPDDADLRPVVPGDLVGEEQPCGERRRHAVRQPEVRVGLGQRRRNSTETRGEHHRPGDEAAAAEDDVGPAPREDPEAVDGGGRRAPRSLNLCRTRSARKAGDGERVELEARLRHQPRLDAVWSAGERHSHSAIPKRFPHCERGTNVTGRSSGRDHACELRRRAHSPRC